MLSNLSDAELVHHVDNKPSATELERELANRLDAKLQLLAVKEKLLARYGIQGGLAPEDDML